MDVRIMGTNEPDKKKKSKNITPFDVARAISAIMIFGVPLIAGATAIIGYGICRIYKKLK